MALAKPSKRIALFSCHKRLLRAIAKKHDKKQIIVKVNKRLNFICRVRAGLVELSVIFKLIGIARP